MGGAGDRAWGSHPPHPTMLLQCKLSGNPVAMAMAALPSPGNHRYLGKGGREEVPGCWQENSRQGLNAQHGFCFPPCATIFLVTAGSGLSLPFSLELHLLVSRPPPAQTLPLHLLSHSSLDWSLCFLNWICSYWGREATPIQGEGGKPRGLIPERHMLQWPPPMPSRCVSASAT